MSRFDSLGDRMKMYEKAEDRRFMPTLPVYARIDGRSFSKFTKGMKRPYDEKMSSAMIETTKALVEETNADMGYTQSDEISLVWHKPDARSSIFFDGRVQKMVSQLGAIASVHFFRQAQYYWPEKVENKLPTFDARVFALPNRMEAINAFIWREWDATKNSFFMAAYEYFSHKQLYKKNQSDMFDMLLEKGVNWNEYPTFFKRGTYVARRLRDVALTTEEMQKIPAKHRPERCIVQRSFIEELDMPVITEVANKEAVFFGQADPITNAKVF